MLQSNSLQIKADLSKWVSCFCMLFIFYFLAEIHCSLSTVIFHVTDSGKQHDHQDYHDPKSILTKLLPKTQTSL